MSNNDGTENNEYEVGYKKPPEHSRFKPGKSGNPKGRKKGQRNLKTDLESELYKKVKVREGNKDISITRQLAIIKVLSAKALKGDQRAIEKILALKLQLGDQEDDEQINNKEISLKDKEIIDAYFNDYQKEKRDEKR